MKIFQCDRCENPIYFENTVCENCDSALGFLVGPKILSSLVQKKDGWATPADPGGRYRLCANHRHQACNWLVPVESDQSLCTACGLNGTIPNLENSEHLTAWQKLEAAKHRLVYELLCLGLPLQSKTEAPETGLSFDFLSNDALHFSQRSIVTGHSQGTITINIAEADSSYREKAREKMGEPYRTLIGHLRHEIGHYYWEVMIRPDAERLQEFRTCFGDEQADYAQTLQQYYQAGPPEDWRERFLSAYCAAHPWEDWAETWAHYLHMVDTLETAHAFGLRLNPGIETLPKLKMPPDYDPYRIAEVQDIVDCYVPLTLAVNSINRSMGQPDLYPFVLSPPAVEKLGFVHRLLRRR